ncbi:MAG: hypothetical protein ABI693_16595 [Bryobacteraceae bacterium]
MFNRQIGSLSVALACFIASCGSGCNDTSRQRQAVIEATQQLRTDYNSGDCGRIYDGSDPGFRKAETQERWLADCVEIRKRLGRWKDFTAETNNAWPIGKGVLWVRGPALFEGGTFAVRTDWRGAERPLLYNLLILTPSKPIDIPGYLPGRPVE